MKCIGILPPYFYFYNNNNNNSRIYSSGSVTGNSPLSSLYNFLYFCDYRQFNNIINANGRCLDLVISGFHCLVEKASDSLVNEDLHHPSLLITIKRQKPRQKSINNNRSAHKQWNFRRADYPGLYKYLTDSNWEFLNNINDVNQACSLFYDQINMALELHVPKTHRLRKSSFPPWFTAAIISNLKLKWRLLRNFRLRKSVGTYSRFKRVRSELKRDIKAAFVNYTSNLEAKIKFEPRRFWSYVNNLNSSNAIPSQMMYSDKLLTKPVDIVNAFAEHFSSNYNTCNIDNIDNFLDGASNTSFNLTSISESEVLCALKQIKANNTSGHDNIPAFLLSDCAAVLAYPLSILFNLILKTCTFPDVWKLSIISPVFKCGERTAVENYRPISLICNFAKIFETVLHKSFFFNIRSLISDSQHGFVIGRSTVTNLCAFTQFAADQLDAKLQVDVVYTDYSKAFDKLNHNILLAKLSNYRSSFLDRLLVLTPVFICEHLVLI
ncbi:uncharacterized protein LOC135123838 [Zophobas morio]|uniref:uncharacterized protein LOC135123838 n=1 Tax=Zophobas morio TaxID=2755281 RepID=UPI003082CF6B